MISAVPSSRAPTLRTGVNYQSTIPTIEAGSAVHTIFLMTLIISAKWRVACVVSVEVTQSWGYRIKVLAFLVHSDSICGTAFSTNPTIIVQPGVNSLNSHYGWFLISKEVTNLTFLGLFCVRMQPCWLLATGHDPPVSQKIQAVARIHRGRSCLGRPELFYKHAFNSTKDFFSSLGASIRRGAVNHSIETRGRLKRGDQQGK